MDYFIIFALGVIAGLVAGFPALLLLITSVKEPTK